MVKLQYCARFLKRVGEFGTVRKTHVERGAVRKERQTTDLGTTSRIG